MYFSEDGFIISPNFPGKTSVLPHLDYVDLDFPTLSASPDPDTEVYFYGLVGDITAEEHSQRCSHSYIQVYISHFVLH